LKAFLAEKLGDMKKLWDNTNNIAKKVLDGLRVSLRVYLGDLCP
jgi:hypothetical protein